MKHRRLARLEALLRKRRHTPALDRELEVIAAEVERAHGPDRLAEIVAEVADRSS